MLIARLIADTSGLETRLDAASAELAQHGIAIAEAAMLDFCGDVLELSLPTSDPMVLAGVLDRHFSPSDLLIADHEIEVPRLFVSDMDSTMIGQECIDELADYAGIKAQVSEITERAMQGELDFADALRERVALLADLDETAIAQCLAERIRPMAGAKTLLATLRAKGCRSVLVTGGFHHFADPVADEIGFDRVVANRLAVTNGRLTGTLDGPIADASTKLAALVEERGLLGAGARTLASGDGANDVPMLTAADYGFAYRAKPAARNAANGRIERGDLTAILSLLAIPREEWVIA